MITRREVIKLAAFPLLPGWLNKRAFASGMPIRPAPLPQAYMSIGRAVGVPPYLLYAIALQESQMKYGQSALPYPWTLNIAGIPKRFKSFGAAVATLTDCLRAGVVSVDCGLLQINWKYHHARLGSVTRALDPYPNIQVGAQILREHFDETKSWLKAVALYHNADLKIGTAYAAAVIRLLSRIPTQEGGHE